MSNIQSPTNQQPRPRYCACDNRSRMPFDKVACWLSKEAEENWAQTEFDRKARPSLRDRIDALKSIRKRTSEQQFEFSEARKQLNAARITLDRRLQAARMRYAGHHPGSEPTFEEKQRFYRAAARGEVGNGYVGRPQRHNGPSILFTGPPQAPSSYIPIPIAYAHYPPPVQHPPLVSQNPAGYSTASEYPPPQHHHYPTAAPASSLGPSSSQPYHHAMPSQNAAYPAQMTEPCAPAAPTDPSDDQAFCQMVYDRLTEYNARH